MEKRIEEKELQEKSKQLGREYIDSMLDPNSPFVQYGLTKREYFAGLAMQGLLSNPAQIDTTNFEWVAQHAVGYADALLEQLLTE